MKQLFNILVFIFSVSGSLHSQTDSVYTGDKPAGTKPEKRKKDNAWKEKFTYGGNFQAYFGNPTFIYVSPSIGYMILDNVNVGVGMIYNYTHVDYGSSGKYSQSIFGGHSYIRYSFTPSFFLQGQFDKLLQPDIYNFKNPNQKIWIDYVMGGAGYSQPIGQSVVFNTSLMYNFTYNAKYSIYPSPFVFQIGIVGRIK
ncbi:MAG: hypothetical protein JWO32_1548 [Bacteroidetes bacterium]|nr:hypothetical protein [Bacteroidota bacterium]